MSTKRDWNKAREAMADLTKALADLETAASEAGCTDVVDLTLLRSQIEDAADELDEAYATYGAEL